MKLEPTIYKVRSKMFKTDVHLPDNCDTFYKRIEFEQNMIFFIERLAYLEFLDQDTAMPFTIVKPTKIIIKIKGGSYLYNKRPLPMKALDIIEKYDNYEKDGYTHEIRI